MEPSAHSWYVLNQSRALSNLNADSDLVCTLYFEVNSLWMRSYSHVDELINGNCISWCRIVYSRFPEVTREDSL